MFKSYPQNQTSGEGPQRALCWVRLAFIRGRPLTGLKEVMKAVNYQEFFQHYVDNHKTAYPSEPVPTKEQFDKLEGMFFGGAVLTFMLLQKVMMTGSKDEILEMILDMETQLSQYSADWIYLNRVVN